MSSSPPSLIAHSDLRDALGTLELLKDDKIGLHMIDLGGDVTGNGISKLVFTILSAVAENERDRIRERVRDAKRHWVTQRHYNGGKRPFEFDVVEGKLVPNPNEQGALGVGLKLRATGKTYRHIAEVWGVGTRSAQVRREERSAHPRSRRRASDHVTSVLAAPAASNRRS